MIKIKYISILAVFSKVFETIIAEQLLEYFFYDYMTDAKCTKCANCIVFKLYTIHNQFTPKYLCDTLQSYHTLHRYSTHISTNSV